MKREVALIGAGYWGRNILRNLFEMGVLHTVCDTDSDVIVSVKKKYPGVNFTTSLGEVLKDREIKAVVIATPAVTHFSLARRALNRGKDVFVEKPLALTSKEGKELVEIAKRRGKILMVGHILIFHPAIKRLKELIDKGELGKIYYIYSNRLNIGKLRIEENILWSFAPHDISVTLMLMEEDPVKVSSFGGDYLMRGIVDVTLTTLEFQNGVKAHIFVSWLHPYKEQKLVVVGSKAMAVFDDLSDIKLSLYPHRIEWKRGKIPVAEKAQRIPVEVDMKEPLREELEHFIYCIKERITPRTDGREGVRVLKILERAQKKLQRGKESWRKDILFTRVPTSMRM